MIPLVTMLTELEVVDLMIRAEEKLLTELNAASIAAEAAFNVSLAKAAEADEKVAVTKAALDVIKTAYDEVKYAHVSHPLAIHTSKLSLADT